MFKVLAVVCFVLPLASAQFDNHGFFCHGIPAGLKLRHPVPNICNEYIACHHGEEHEWICPGNQFFSQAQQRCVAACDPTEALSGVCLSMPNGQLMRPPLSQMPYNCRQYFMCASGVAIQQLCPEGTYFSQLNQNCGSVREDLCIID